MGSQVNYFMTPVDIDALEPRLQRVTPMLVLGYKSQSATPTIMNSLSVNDMGSEELTRFLVRQEDLWDVKPRFVANQGYWTLDTNYPPIIEFDRCYCKNGLIGPGRMYFKSGHYENQEWVEKSPEFLTWAKKLLGITRRFMKRGAVNNAHWASWYWAPDALARYESGELKIRSPFPNAPKPLSG